MSKQNPIDVKFNSNMKPHKTQLSIERILKMPETKYDVNPPYQRGVVWNNTRRRKLIDSIICGRSINAVHMALKNNDPLCDEYYVIDGRQRIETIRKFKNCDFNVLLKIDDETSKEVSYDAIVTLSKKGNRYCSKFLDIFYSYEIDYNEYDKMTIDQQRDLFDCINQTEKLHSNEILYCSKYLTKKFYEFVWENVFCDIKKWFKKCIANNNKFKGTRFAHEVCRLCFGEGFNDLFSPQNIGNEDMTKISSNFDKRLVSDGLVAFDNITLDYVINIMSSDNYYLLKKVCKVVNNALEINSIPDTTFDVNLIFDFIIFTVNKFQQKIWNVSYCTSVLKDINELFMDYRLYKIENKNITQNSKGKFKIENRMNIFETIYNDDKYMFDRCKKDKEFSKIEKENIILDSNGICPITNSKLTLENSEIHHEKGKKLSSKNKGVLIHKSANNLIGNPYQVPLDFSQ